MKIRMNSKGTLCRPAGHKVCFPSWGARRMRGRIMWQKGRGTEKEKSWGRIEEEQLWATENTGMGGKGGP